MKSSKLCLSKLLTSSNIFRKNSIRKFEFENQTLVIFDPTYSSHHKFSKKRGFFCFVLATIYILEAVKKCAPKVRPCYCTYMWHASIESTLHRDKVTYFRAVCSYCLFVVCFKKNVEGGKAALLFSAGWPISFGRWLKQKNTPQKACAAIP